MAGKLDPLRARQKAAILKAMPGAQYELVLRTGFTQSMIQRLVRRYHADGDVHISSWSRRHHGGKPVATYSAGRGVDKFCAIKPFPAIVKATRRYRDLCASGEVQELLARKRARYWADRSKPDPLVAALFGKPQQKALNER